MGLWDTIKKPFKWRREFLQRHTIVADVWTVIKWPVRIILLFFVLGYHAALSGSGDLVFLVMLLPYGILGLVALAFTPEGQIILFVLFVIWDQYRRWKKRRESKGGDVDGAVGYD